MIQKNAHPKTTCRVMERTRRSCTSNSCHMRECRVIACHMYLDLSDKFHQGRQFGCKSISATLPFTNRDRRSRMYKSFALLARPENNVSTKQVLLMGMYCRNYTFCNSTLPTTPCFLIWNRLKNSWPLTVDHKTGNICICTIYNGTIFGLLNPI